MQGSAKGYSGANSGLWLKKEVSSDKNWKEDFYETTLCYVYSSHIDKAFITLFSLETLSWTDPQRDIQDHIQD